MFDIAAGTVAGVSHQRAGRNSQDGFAYERRGDVIVAVVTDGCGSARHSEVGAKLGARIAARALLDAAPTRAWNDAAAAIARSLRAVGAMIADDVRASAEEYLLFTIVAAVVTPERTTILSAGDGMFAINGERHVIGPFENNAPPYLGYAVADGDDASLTVEREMATACVESIALATDGATALEDLDAVCEGDLVFRNPDAIRRRLFLLTRPQSPRLDDDTTVVVLRRSA